MKNADLPANPQPIALNETECLSTSEHYGHNEFNGLTKREMFAMHAMQGLLSNSGGVVQSNSMSGTGFCNSDERSLAQWSIACADALLEELSK
ncbi:MAG: hypothetical protein Tp1137MES00d2C23059491_40 [Prokaryotic dsDNA virus sp.]|nr:MAG: hypothetical protein Tp1137MES00d2C23059491_40 [Prokaryotic dsDNA virus sp.]